MPSVFPLPFVWPSDATQLLTESQPGVHTLPATSIYSLATKLEVENILHQLLHLIQNVEYGGNLFDRNREREIEIFFSYPDTLGILH